MRIQHWTLTGFLCVFVLANLAADLEPEVNVSSEPECRDCFEPIVVVPPSDPQYERELAKFQRLIQRRREWARSVREAQMMQDRGTEISFDKDEPEPMHALLQAFCDYFKAENPVPTGRVKHFADVVQEAEARIQGWSCQIRSARETKDGWRLLISVTPYLATRKAGVAMTPANCIEDWLISEDAQLTLIGLTAGERPRVVFYD